MPFIICAGVAVFAAAILIPVKPVYWLELRERIKSGKTGQRGFLIAFGRGLGNAYLKENSGGAMRRSDCSATRRCARIRAPFSRQPQSG